MKKILLAILCMALSSVLFAQTLKNGSGSGLNLRSQPSTEATVLASIPPNARVTVVEKSNEEWSKVEYDGQTGYVSSRYLTDKSSKNNNSSANKSNNTNASKSNSWNSTSTRYNTGIGIRFGGWESGLTVKHFIKQNAAIEGILSTGWHYRGTRLTALYEIQKPISGVSGLYWFYGIGGHIGLYNERYWYNGDCQNGQYKYNGRWYNCDGSRAVLGIDGIIGLEYLFREIPFTIGLDIKPSIDLFGGGGRYGGFAFSLRYAF